MSPSFVCDHLSTLSTTWLPILIDAAIKGVAILVLISLATLLIRRASAAARHLLWFLATLSVLLLPILSAALPGWHVLPQWSKPVEVTAQAPTFVPPAPTIIQPAPLGRNVPDETITPQQLPPTPLPIVHAPVVQPLPAPAPRPIHLNWQAVVLLTWLTGTFILLIYIATGYASLWWLQHRSTRISHGSWPILLEQLAQQIRFTRRVILLSSPRRAMPMTWGLWQTRILLPEDSTSWTPDQRRAVLLHELAHARRGDCITQLIAQLARAAYWFNPLLWLAWNRMQSEREKACDDLVLSSGTRASTYAEQLLHIASEMPAVRFSAAAIAMARPSKLEGRLLAILDVTRNRKTLTRKAIAVACFLLLGVSVPVAILSAQQNTAAKKSQASLPPPGFGQIEDANGAPIAGAKVQSQDTNWSALTSVVGSFKLPATRPDAFSERIEIAADGFVPRQNYLSYDWGWKLVSNHGVFQLHRYGSLEGRILGPDNKPLAGAPISVSVFQRYDVPSLTVNAVRAISDAQGRFVIENVPPGELLLSYPWEGPSRDEIESGRWKDWTLPGKQWPSPPITGIGTARAVELKDDQHLPDVILDLSKSIATASGRVLDQRGQPLAGVDVCLAWKGPSFSTSADTPQGIAPARTDNEGKYHLEKLPLGDWHVQASEGNAFSDLVPVNLSETPEQVPDLILPVIKTPTGRLRRMPPMNSDHAVREWIDATQAGDSDGASAMVVPQSPFSRNSARIASLLGQIKQFPAVAMSQAKRGSSAQTNDIDFIDGHHGYLTFKVENEAGMLRIYDVEDQAGTSLMTDNPTVTRQAILQDKPTKDQLLSTANQKLRDGLKELSKTYPQLSIASNNPLETALTKSSDKSAIIAFELGRSNHPQMVPWKPEEIPDNQTWSLTAVIIPGDPPVLRSDDPGPQQPMMSLYPHLHLQGRLFAQAADPKLDAALKKLLADALAPLVALDARTPSDAPATQPTSRPTQAKLHLVDPQGKPVNNMYVVSANLGWTSKASHVYWPDKAGLVNIDPIDAGTHWYIINTAWPNPTLIKLEVPPEGADKSVMVQAMDLPDPQNNPRPDLEVEVKQRTEKGKAFIDATITNIGQQPYTLTENDLQLVSPKQRALPPASEQKAKLVVPAHDARTVTLDWSAYLERGIWCSRLGEDIGEKGPATAPAGYGNYRVKVGITMSVPLAMEEPQSPATQPAAMPTWEQFQTLLGKSIDSPEVARFAATYGLKKYTKFDSGGFENSEAQPFDLVYRENRIVRVEVEIIPNPPFPNVSRYTGTLPNGVEPLDTAPDVIHRLGAPQSDSQDQYSQDLVYKDLRLTFVFDLKRRGALEEIFLDAPPPPATEPSTRPQAELGQAANAPVEAAASKLDFRIAAAIADVPHPTGNLIPQATANDLIASLQKDGPAPKFHWTPEPDFGWYESSDAGDRLISGNYNNHHYVLLMNRDPYIMLAETNGRKTWGLESVYLIKNTDGAIEMTSIGFKFDAAGADLFGKLTQANLKQRLAMLIDGEVVSSPNIMAPIHGSAEISGNGPSGFDPAEAARIVDALRRGMPPVPSPATQPAAIDIDEANETMQNMVYAIRRVVPIRLCLENLDFDRANNGITIDQAISTLEASQKQRDLSPMETRRLELARKMINDGQPGTDLFDWGPWYSFHIQATSVPDALDQLTHDTAYVWKKLGDNYIVLPAKASALQFLVTLNSAGITRMQAMQKVAAQSPEPMMTMTTNPQDPQTNAPAPQMEVKNISAMSVLCDLTPGTVWELGGVHGNRLLSITAGPAATTAATTPSKN